MNRQQRLTGHFRPAPNRHGSAYWRIGMPREIAELVAGVAFTCHLTTDGILYRPASEATDDVPEWVRAPILSRGSRRPGADGTPPWPGGGPLP